MNKDEPIRNRIVCRPKVAIAMLCIHLLSQINQLRDIAIVTTANSIDKTRSFPVHLYASFEPRLRNISTGVTLSCRANKPLKPIKAVEETRIPVTNSTSYTMMQKTILRPFNEVIITQKQLAYPIIVPCYNYG